MKFGRMLEVVCGNTRVCKRDFLFLHRLPRGPDKDPGLECFCLGGDPGDRGVQT